MAQDRLRTVICSGSAAAVTNFERAVAGSEGFQLVGCARTAAEALMQCRVALPEIVAIDQSLEDSDGLAVAKRLASERPMPFLLFADRTTDSPMSEMTAADRMPGVRMLSRATLSDPRPEAQARLRTQLSLLATDLRQWRGRRLVRPPSSVPVAASPSPDLAAIAADCYDAVILVGSAGTPQMLTEVMPHLGEVATPLVLVVHHNPRFSESFRSWVRRLTPSWVYPLVPSALSVRGMAPGVHVVPAGDPDASSDVLGPDIDRTLSVFARARQRVLVCVCSGMGQDGVDGLAAIQRTGGVALAVDPDACAQPRMPTTAIRSGLVHGRVSVEDLVWVVRSACRSAASEPPALADVSNG